MDISDCGDASTDPKSVRNTVGKGQRNLNPHLPLRNAQIVSFYLFPYQRVTNVGLGAASGQAEPWGGRST
jgi:hypothetical protein